MTRGALASPGIAAWTAAHHALDPRTESRYLSDSGLERGEKESRLMKVKVRQRKDAGKTAVWLADIHVVPKGADLPERFRMVAPDGITSKSGATRWAMEAARKIAAEGRPHGTAKAREERQQREEEAKRRSVPTLAEYVPIYLETMSEILPGVSGKVILDDKAPQFLPMMNLKQAK